MAALFSLLLALVVAPSFVSATRFTSSPENTTKVKTPSNRPNFASRPVRQYASTPYTSSLENATATFYGGRSGSGTMNGACGYGNLTTMGYGMMNAAASVAMWQGGSICGACFRVRCAGSKYCIPGAFVVVTVTNLCPQGSEGGWCNTPKHHLDMSVPAWLNIGSDVMAGVIPTTMQRVACNRQGGIKVQLEGHMWWTQVLVANVGSSGDIVALDVSVDRGRTWSPFQRNWGAVFSGMGLIGKSVSFRMRTGLVTTHLKILDALPSTWQFKTVYTLAANFP